MITLEALAAFPRLLEAHYADIPAALKNWAPPSWEGIPSERFTAIEQVCHVRDIEIEGYQVRFRRTLDELNPMLPGIDSESLAVSRAYASSAAASALADFAKARAATLALVSGLEARQLDRAAIFECYGRTSLRGLIHYLCSHDQQHLAGLQWLLGKMQAAQATPREHHYLTAGTDFCSSSGRSSNLPPGRQTSTSLRTPKRPAR